MGAKVSVVSIQDEGELESYYQACGLAPEIILPATMALDYQKTTYCIDDLFLCSTQSLSGWGFRKQHETDVYFLSFTTDGMSEWKMRDVDTIRCARQLCVVDSSRLITGHFFAGTKTETIMLPSDLLHAEMSVLQGYPCQRRLEFLPMVTPSTDTWGAITSVVHALRTNIGGGIIISPIAISYLRQALVSSILERVPNNFTEVINGIRLEVLPGALRRALDYMMAEAGSPIGLTEIALAAGTSGRNLQLLFKSHRGRSPLAILRDIRLQRCREEFQYMDEIASLMSVAARWGFTNRHTFSIYYQERFGETPKQTWLRKRR